MQFEKDERLQPAIALVSVVALSLLQMCAASRRSHAKERSATDLVRRDYVDVLSRWRHQQVQPNWSLHDFCYALAHLGGHQNRNDDHPRDWTKLQFLVQGADLQSRRSKRCG